MKIAIIHDWLVTDAGAEKVLKSICELYPDADIFSLVDFLDAKDKKEIINSKKVTTTFIQKLPFSKKYFRYYLALFPIAIESLNLNSYDLIISSSWAVAKGVKTYKNQLHICYCHTPIRYAWDLYDEYTSNLKGLKALFVKWTLKRLRKWDIDTLDRVDYFVANSKFVQERIKRTYDRDSIVIYPPVDVDRFELYKDKDDFYITASRLVPYKKTKLIVEAFNEMPDKKLVVIGAGEEYDAIKEIAKENISVLGYCANDVLVDYMQRAKCFVYGAVEDFGIIPIEAMACGTPVVALNQGGTKETVEDGINGIHFQHQIKDDIIKAIKRFESKKFVADDVRVSALKYKDFKDKFGEFVKDRCKDI
ncbi:MAG: glycosyltransferase [Campylobacterales bacterium]